MTAALTLSAAAAVLMAIGLAYAAWRERRP